MAKLYVAFPGSFSLDNIPVAIIEGLRLHTESDNIHNMKHCISGSALKFQTYK